MERQLELRVVAATNDRQILQRLGHNEIDFFIRQSRAGSFARAAYHGGHEFGHFAYLSMTGVDQYRGGVASVDLDLLVLRGQYALRYESIQQTLPGERSPDDFDDASIVDGAGKQVLVDVDRTRFLAESR